MMSSAMISDCGNYRYWLTRQWDNGCLLPFVMLNPSTADANDNDPTIRRCMTFARGEGFAGISVVNLFAFRATNPDALRSVRDPVGPDNDEFLIQELRRNRKVVAAWGAVPMWRDRINYVLSLAELNEVDLRCVGQTNGGFPRHPLYVPAAQRLEAYRPWAIRGPNQDGSWG